MRLIGAIPRRLRHMLYFCVACTAVCAGMLLAALPSRAQDAVEAARQEKARKAKEQKAAPHVYTEEDLKRERILTPSDQARTEAKKKNSAAPGTSPQPALDAEKNPESLGEIARRYRREKAARESEQALKKQPASGFPMNVPAESFAVPKPPVVPRNEAQPPVFHSNPARVAPNFSQPVSPAPPAMDPEVPRTTEAPRRRVAPRRISPFEPRPYVAPVIPLSPSSPARVAPVNPSAPPLGAIHGKLRIVVVKAGDSWWKLSRVYLGRGSRWEELLALNPARGDPNFLAGGGEVLIPVAGSSPPQASRVTVQKGDTLWAIARAHFGSGAVWTCLARANPQVINANLILPGQVLQLPESCGKPR